MRQANLSEAHLKGANFTSANLKGVNFSHATYLDEARFKNVVSIENALISENAPAQFKEWALKNGATLDREAYINWIEAHPLSPIPKNRE